MTTYLDIPALRAADEAHFFHAAKKAFAENPNVHSIVLAVAQFFADEAADAVHTLAVRYPTREPTWPHRCPDVDGTSAADGSQCDQCLQQWQPFGQLDSNSDAVYAYSAFCGEYGGGEGETWLHDPILVARREPDGGVSLEHVAHLVRPWMDFPNAFADRGDDEDLQSPPPKPEPEVVPWTAEEAPLVERIYAAPAEDGPRRVIVDHWLEKNDPRGDFGTLSFDQTPNRSFDRAWLGPLTAVVGYAAATFARGPFADKVTACFRDQETLAKHVGHREWATVSSLRFSEGPVGFSPAMAGLTEALGVTAEGLRSLAKSATPWKITTLGFAVGQENVKGLVETWTACPTLPAVKALVLEGVAPQQDLEPLLQSEKLASLEKLEVWLVTDDGWEEGLASRTVDLIRARWPKLELTVGTQTEAGARRGFVLTSKEGAVRLEQQGLDAVVAVSPAAEAHRGLPTDYRDVLRPMRIISAPEPPNKAGKGNMLVFYLLVALLGALVLNFLNK